jgi:hypothetical protein
MGRGGNNTNYLYKRITPDVPQDQNRYLLKQSQKNPELFAELWFKEFRESLLQGHYQYLISPMIENFYQEEWEEVDYDINSYLDGEKIVLDIRFIGLLEGNSYQSRYQEITRDLEYITIKQMLEYDFYINDSIKTNNLVNSFLADD